MNVFCGAWSASGIAETAWEGRDMFGCEGGGVCNSQTSCHPDTWEEVGLGWGEELWARREHITLSS